MRGDHGTWNLWCKGEHLILVFHNSIHHLISSMKSSLSHAHNQKADLMRVMKKISKLSHCLSLKTDSFLTSKRDHNIALQTIIQRRILAPIKTLRLAFYVGSYHKKRLPMSTPIKDMTPNLLTRKACQQDVRTCFILNPKPNTLHHLLNKENPPFAKKRFSWH